MVDDADAGPDRHGELVAKLVSQALEQPDPEAWIRFFTLKALRALSADKNSSAVIKGEARRQIHDLARHASHGIVVARRKLPVPRIPEDETVAAQTSDAA